MTHLEGCNGTRARVHVIAGEDVQRRLVARLEAAGMETRTYTHLAEFLTDFFSPDTGLPCCLVIDAQPAAIHGCEAQAIRLPLAIRCPIVVLDHPFCELKTGSAVVAAIETNRRQRLVEARNAEICVRFSTLTRREREVMSLVVTGLLNKQVGGDLGISEITIKAHRGSVMRKMGARSLADLVRMADAIAACDGEQADVVRSARSGRARSAAFSDLHTG